MDENNRSEDTQDQFSQPAEQIPGPPEGQSNNGQDNNGQGSFAQMSDENQPYYSQLQNQNIYQPVQTPKPPKKSYGGIIAAAAAVFLLLVTAAAAAFMFRDTLLNSFAKLTKSPAEYYSYIEKNAIEEVLDDVTSSSFVSPLSNEGKVAYETSSDISINRDTLDSILQSSAGMSLSDLEDQIGLQFDKLSFDAVIAKDGSLLNETMGFRLNEVKLITAELFMDREASELYLRLPELSKAYLNLSSQDLSSSVDLASLDEITPERTADFLKRYSDLLIDHTKKVSLEDHAKLSVDTLTTQCTKLTVTITEEDALDMISSVLDEAGEDEYILDILPLFNLSEDDYQNYIDEAKDEVNSAYDTISDESIDMILYVNSKGEILSRQFNIDNSDISFGYTKLSKGNYDEYRLFATDKSGVEILNIEGSQTKKQDAYTGDSSIELNTGDDSSSAISLDISYEDLRSEKKDNMTYLYGTIHFSSLDLMGLQGTLEYSVEDDVQNCKIDIQVGAMPIATLNITVRPLEDYEIAMPAKDAEIYDLTQAEDYYSTFDLKDYLTDLSGRLGIDPEIIDSLISEFSNY